MSRGPYFWPKSRETLFQKESDAPLQKSLKVVYSLAIESLSKRIQYGFLFSSSVEKSSIISVLYHSGKKLDLLNVDAPAISLHPRKVISRKMITLGAEAREMWECLLFVKAAACFLRYNFGVNDIAVK